MKVNNLITLNEKVIAQVWIKSIQIMCYDFYNIFYRKWEKEKRVKPTHANEFFLLSALTNKIMITADAFFIAIPAYDKKEINTFMDLLDIVESETLFTMLKKTDKQLQQIFLLRYYGYEVEEISDLLNIKPDTIYKKIQRFKEKLKKQ